MPRPTTFVLAAALVLGGATLGLIGPWADRSAEMPKIARPRTGPPPVPGPRHTVNYPKPPLELPETLPPWRFDPIPPELLERFGTNSPNPPATLADLTRVRPEGKTRCEEGARTRLYVLDRDVLDLDLPAEEALALEGSVVFDEDRGRLAGKRGLPLAALLRDRKGARALEAWPCTGDPVRFGVGELTAEPERRVLVLSRQRGFKLMDFGGERPTSLLKNLAAIRIVR